MYQFVIQTIFNPTDDLFVVLTRTLRLVQQGLDAQRATQMQRLYAPYQQLGFLSDIYRGAPSTQMATTAVSQPSASPFQQAAGIGLAGLTAAAGAAKAGLFG